MEMVNRSLPPFWREFLSTFFLLVSVVGFFLMLEAGFQRNWFGVFFGVVILLGGFFVYLKVVLVSD